jgi:serine/threonine protein phosphatase 1
MFAQLRPRRLEPVGKPRTAAGERIYAVGDVHGRMDLLLQLLSQIEQDDSLREPRRKRLIFLGDLIDRGPKSKEVVSLLSQAQRSAKRLLVLMGNHEAALLDTLDGDEDAQKMWLAHGGAATLDSFGINPPEEGESAASFADRMKQHLPPALVRWLRNLPLSMQSGSYFFCHAGVRPGVKLAHQRPEDLLWIRRDFLESDGDHGAVIVHGHSVCGDSVEITHNRINLDTGAYNSGILSAIGLQDDEQWVLSTSPAESRSADGGQNLTGR